jgi:hypothetical protein
LGWEPDWFMYRAGLVPPGTGRTRPVPTGFANPALLVPAVLALTTSTSCTAATVLFRVQRSQSYSVASAPHDATILLHTRNGEGEEGRVHNGVLREAGPATSSARADAGRQQREAGRHTRERVRKEIKG